MWTFIYYDSHGSHTSYLYEGEIASKVAFCVLKNYSFEVLAPE